MKIRKKERFKLIQITSLFIPNIKLSISETDSLKNLHILGTFQIILPGKAMDHFMNNKSSLELGQQTYLRGLFQGMTGEAACIKKSEPFRSINAEGFHFWQSKTRCQICFCQSEKSTRRVFLRSATSPKFINANSPAKMAEESAIVYFLSRSVYFWISIYKHTRCHRLLSTFLVRVFWMQHKQASVCFLWASGCLKI